MLYLRIFCSCSSGDVLLCRPRHDSHCFMESEAIIYGIVSLHRPTRREMAQPGGAKENSFHKQLVPQFDPNPRTFTTTSRWRAPSQRQVIMIMIMTMIMTVTRRAATAVAAGTMVVARNEELANPWFLLKTCHSLPLLNTRVNLITAVDNGGRSNRV